MTVDPKAAPPSPLPDGPPGSSPPKSFAFLAKRVWNWTTNCIVSALILVLGLGFGRQVIRWWAVDTPGNPVSHAPLELGEGWGEPGRLHEIRFGNSAWQVRREPAKGDREQALAELRSSCREATRSSSLPPGVAAQGEQRLLDALRKHNPADREAGKWRLYELEDHFPIVVGVREPEANGATPGQNVAQEGSRVVTWGLAVPMSAGNWTLYTFHQTSPSAGGSQDFGVPPNGNVALALEVEGGGRLMAVRGPARMEVWKSFYDQWFADRGWTAAGAWRQVGQTWSRRYWEKSEQRAGRTDVQFGEDSRGGVSGLLLYAPAPDKSTESERP